MTGMQTLLRWLAGCLLWLFTLSAQAITPLHDYFSESWTTRNGLPHNTINDISQSGDGYLWLATWEGAARYDGRNFTVFGRGQQTGLPDAGMRTLQLEADGSLLVAGSRGGFARVNHGQWQSYPPLGFLINHLLRDQRGQLWFATEGGGVVRQRSDGSYQRYGQAEGLTSRVVYKILQDRQGILWFTTPQGLYRLDPLAAQPTFELLAADSGLPPVSAFVVALDGDGVLLVGTEHGLYRWQQQSFVLLDARLAGVSVSALMLRADGQIWIGTINQGLFRLSSLGLEQISVVQGLPNNRVLAIFEDAEHSIWIGTNGGLFRLRETPFTNLTQAQGLNDNYVRTVLEDRNGDVWIGSAGGLNVLRKGVLSRVALKDQASVLSLTQGPDGDIWVGTYADGVFRLRHGQVVGHLTRADGLASNEVRAIAVSAEQAFFGTSGGLSVWQQERFRNLTLAHGLPALFVTALKLQQLPDASAPQLWVGTGAGAALWRDGELKKLDFSALEGTEYVFDFHLATDPRWVWLATDRGLIRYDQQQGSLRLIGQKSGMPVEKVFSVLPDHHGAFWLSSNRGIVRLLQQDVIAVADGQHERLQTAELFGETDGMQSAQCNGGSMPAASVRQDGTLWFATSQGVATLDPDRLEQFSLKPPPVVVQALSADGREVPLEQASLPAGTRRVKVQYAGLSYMMPSRILYRTQLQGFEQDWVDRGSSSVAEYTNLPPGQYRLLVSAAYPESDWSTAVAWAEFHIEPFFWQQRWVQFAAGLLLTLAVLGFIRWRLLRLSQSELRLRYQVAEKTAELLAQAQSLRQLVTEKTALAEQLKSQANAFEAQAREDGLTGLANRRAFDERLALEFARAQRQQQPLCLVMLDVDHFKTINDRFSHQVGDQVLQQLAQLLKAQIREIDLVARWGGEEFALLLPQTTLDIATEVCERLREAIAALQFAIPELQVTASFGIACNLDVSSYDKLLSRAVRQLYQAKNRGRNCVCC